MSAPRESADKEEEEEVEKEEEEKGGEISLREYGSTTGCDTSLSRIELARGSKFTESGGHFSFSFLRAFFPLRLAFPFFFSSTGEPHASSRIASARNTVSILRNLINFYPRPCSTFNHFEPILEYDFHSRSSWVIPDAPTNLS